MSGGGLTPREREVLQAVADAGSAKRAARQLGISHNTVHGHLAQVRAKLASRSVAQAVATAFRKGVLTSLVVAALVGGATVAEQPWQRPRGVGARVRAAARQVGWSRVDGVEPRRYKLG